MRRTVESLASGPRGGVRAGIVLLGALALCGAPPAAAFQDTPNPVLEMGYNPSGAFIIDGSYVMNVGEVQINITNWGLIGSAFSVPTPFSDAPSCQWPAGSGNEYLWSSGIWIGGVVLGERLVSTGGWNSEIYPLDEIEATIYEAIGNRLMRPPGNTDASGRRAPMPNPNDDDDFDPETLVPRIDEETLNGKDDDGDTRIDEDFGQIGNQMMVLTQYDNTRLAQENNPDHTPMNLEIIQKTYQWENDQVDDFVGFEYTITNVGVTDIERVYLGFFSDADIGPRAAEGVADDDMAGSWKGLVRASDGSFVPVEVGYMYDAAEQGRIEGYFGVVFLGHDVDPSGNRAPPRIGLRTFQSFSGTAAFEQGGDPTNDDERYQLLRAAIADGDANTLPGQQADFRFLVSAGPFLTLRPDESLRFQVGMVVGPGLGNPSAGRGLLANCAEAALTWYGIWVDEIKSVETESGRIYNPGELGRETLLCRDDYEGGGGDNPWDSFLLDFGDASCVGAADLIGGDTPGETTTFTYKGKTCAMFNMDNCFECARQLGRYCTEDDFKGWMENTSNWECRNPAGNKFGCTGVEGAETNINWLVGMAPPPPDLRLWSTDSRVHVYWDDKPEHTPDIRLQKIDFESYRIWRADNWERPYGSSLENGPESNLWQLIAEYDVINNYVSYRDLGDTVARDTIPLGANSGLEVIAYTPVILVDPAYDGLAEAMQDVVNSTYYVDELPPLHDSNGQLKEEFVGLAPWQYDTAALDTFFAVTYRAENPDLDFDEKRATKYYEYVDRDIHNGFIYFYSVTSTDHLLLPDENEQGIDGNTPVGAGLVGDPGSSFSNTQPGTIAQTAEDRAQNGTNIYVYPNPATRDALAEYQQLFPNGDDPTGVRVTFTNLPRAHNTIKIYTVAGDLVQTIMHDGTTGMGHVSWNLMSRNGQEIVSGVYLYSVQADDSAFDDYVGKFVVVR